MYQCHLNFMQFGFAMYISLYYRQFERCILLLCIRHIFCQIMQLQLICKGQVLLIEMYVYLYSINFRIRTVKYDICIVSHWYGMYYNINIYFFQIFHCFTEYNGYFECWRPFSLLSNHFIQMEQMRYSSAIRQIKTKIAKSLITFSKQYIT